MYKLTIVQDLIVGRNNLGENKIYENLNLRQVNEIFDDFNERFGSPRSTSGMFMWTPSMKETLLIYVVNDKGFYVDCDELVVNYNLCDQLNN